MRIPPTDLTAGERAALQRVAMLVGGGASPEEVAAATVEEIGRLIGADVTALARYDGSGAARIVDWWSVTGAHGQPGPAPLTLGGHNVTTLVLRSGRASRIDDYAGATGAVADAAHRCGICSAIGVPVQVGGRVWGVLTAASTSVQALATDAEAQLTTFVELVATGIANDRARAHLRGYADEQAALRRVATMVASGAPPEQVFTAITAEAGRLLSGDHAVLGRYDAADAATVIGAWSSAGEPSPAPVGSRFELGEEDVYTLVSRLRRPVRIDDCTPAGATGSDVARLAGRCGAVGVPIDVDGLLWGVLILTSTRAQRLPPETDARLAGFAELIATALANAQARLELREFADEQAALRRVATLVARAASPDQVFAAVAEEVGRLLQVGYTVLSRYDPGGAATVVGGWARTDPGRPLAIGLHIRPEGRNIHALVFETRRPVRIDDYGEATGDLADLARDWGYRSAAGVPIIVEGRLWGVMIAGSLAEPLPRNTETRLTGFTELVVTAIANAQSQAALTASRSRIVAADDTARRRLERNLHDGVQQHLVALSLRLREAQARVPLEATDLESRLDGVVDGLVGVLDELREIAHGILPAGLSDGGLRHALTTLAERSAVPVRLDLDTVVAVPEPIEVAAYYVVAESLANATKYADASVIDVHVRAVDAELLVVVRDDGRGGADIAGGSGLVGLRDRVEALGGWLWLRSPPGGGTEVEISLPLRGTGSRDAGAETA